MIIKLIKNGNTEVHCAVTKYEVNDGVLYINSEIEIELTDWDSVYLMNDEGKTVDTISTRYLQKLREADRQLLEKMGK